MNIKVKTYSASDGIDGGTGCNFIFLIPTGPYKSRGKVYFLLNFLE